MSYADQPKSDLFQSDACLTTHMLDLATGRPSEGVKIDLLRHSPNHMEAVATSYTNSDGRLPSPLLTQSTARAGRYTLSFHVDNGFLGVVPIEFNITDTSRHYHVPLVLSPYGYSAYRGAPPHRAPDGGGTGHRKTLNIPEQTAPPPGSLGPGLTVHVIDISRGIGAGGMIVEVQPPAGAPLRSSITNSEGRTTDWLVAAGKLERGCYEIRFDFDHYFQGDGSLVDAQAFFPCARVRFHVKDPGQHYHIPLLAAPWGYSCYRGS